MYKRQGYHRQSYGGCKVGVGDVLIGAAAVAADYNGCPKASHIKDKIIEMQHLNETLYCCGIACSTEGTKTASGNYIIDLLLANVCKMCIRDRYFSMTFQGSGAYLSASRLRDVQNAVFTAWTRAPGSEPVSQNTVFGLEQAF